METWEYLFVTCSPIGTFDVEWRPRYVNGEELEGWKRGGNIFAFANHCGSEGWEMVNTIIGYNQHGGVVDYRVIFKRQIRRAVTTETQQLNYR